MSTKWGPDRIYRGWGGVLGADQAQIAYIGGVWGSDRIYREGSGVTTHQKHAKNHRFRIYRGVPRIYREGVGPTTTQKHAKKARKTTHFAYIGGNRGLTTHQKQPKKHEKQANFAGILHSWRAKGCFSGQKQVKIAYIGGGWGFLGAKQVKNNQNGSKTTQNGYF